MSLYSKKKTEIKKSPKSKLFQCLAVVYEKMTRLPLITKNTMEEIVTHGNVAGLQYNY